MRQLGFILSHSLLYGFFSKFFFWSINLYSISNSLVINGFPRRWEWKSDSFFLGQYLTPCRKRIPSLIDFYYFFIFIDFLLLLNFFSFIISKYPMPPADCFPEFIHYSVIFPLFKFNYSPWFFWSRLLNMLQIFFILFFHLRFISTWSTNCISCERLKHFLWFTLYQGEKVVFYRFNLGNLLLLGVNQSNDCFWFRLKLF